MEVIIQERNIALTHQVHSYIEKKLASLDRRLGRPATIKLEMTQEPTKALGDRVVMQATLDCNGTIIRAEERAPDLMTAMDAVYDVLTRRIARFKTKLHRKGSYKKRPQLSIKDPQPPEPPEPEGPESLVKVKRFALKPMPMEEAIERMELLGHDFFVFLDSSNENFSVLYRRRDGFYGVIVPDIS